MLRLRHRARTQNTYDDVIDSCLNVAMNQRGKERILHSESRDVLFSVLDRVSRDLEESTATNCNVGISRSMSSLTGDSHRLRANFVRGLSCLAISANVTNKKSRTSLLEFSRQVEITERKGRRGGERREEEERRREENRREEKRRRPNGREAGVEGGGEGGGSRGKRRGEERRGRWTEEVRGNKSETGMFAGSLEGPFGSCTS
eukprot:765596-Hanusia_phi.AAC.1